MNPLAGLRVIVTRPRDQAIPLGHSIASLGGTWESVPLIQISLTVSPEVLEKVRQLPTYGLWIATSANGIRGLADACQVVGLLPQAMPCGFVVGKGTLTEARARGFRVRTFNEVRNAFDLGQALAAHWTTPQKVLCLQGNRATTSVSEVLSERGHEVDRCIVYRTEALSVNPAQVVEWCIGEQAHNTAIALYSPSAAEALVASGGRWLTVPPRRAMIVCVGTTTSDWCTKHGISVDGIASEPNDEAVCRRLADVWSSRRDAL